MVKKLSDYASFVDIPKPHSWPANYREVRLSNIFDSTNALIKNPTYKNKEILTSLITLSELNEINCERLK